VPKATKILVALVFLATFGSVGAGACWVIGATIHDAMRAEHWVKVKASVDAYSRGQVSYRYTFGGAEYKGDREGSFVLGGRDNLDSWHADMDAMLREAHDKRQPITVYVNPDDPRESMVDRTLRWKLLAMALPFAIGFGAVGLGALWAIGSTLLSGSAEAQPMVPGAAPVAQRRPSSGLGAQWGFTIVWNAIAFPIAFIAVPGIWESGEWIGLIVLLFPLIGVLMLWGAVSSTLSAIGAMFRSSRREGVDLNALAQAAKVAPPQLEPGAIVFARGMLSEDGQHGMAPVMSAPQPAAAAVLDPDAPPPVAPPTDAELARFEKVLAEHGKLDSRSRAELAKLPPSARKLVMAVLQGSSWIPKIVIAIVVAIIVVDLARSFL